MQPFGIPVIINDLVWEDADSLELEKHGNQFSIDVANNRQGSVSLLIGLVERPDREQKALNLENTKKKRPIGIKLSKLA